MEDSKGYTHEAVPEYDQIEIFKRIVCVLDQKIASVQEEHRKKEDVLSKEEIITGFRKDPTAEETEKFPLSRDAYYNYKASADEKDVPRVRTLRVDTLYEICRYTGVSADYLLGLIDTSRKEQSAEMIRQEFGLSDKSMDFLKTVHDRTPESRGNVTSLLVNTILENSDFWNSLDDILPLYISSKYHYRAYESDTDMIRYSVMRVFENLIDTLAEKLSKIDQTQFSELDRTDPFQ